MHEFSTVTAIGGLCALCGISCVRNFLPTFVFLLACRAFGESGLAPAAGRRIVDGAADSVLNWTAGRAT